MTDRRLRAAIAAVAALGIGVAGYLTWIHYAHAQPFCLTGSGACERVQSSPQSVFLGVPVAVLGLAGYAAILASLAVPGEAGRLLGALLGLSGLGFSLYLTYLELFEIHAICQWCVASAVLMTALAVLTSARLVLAATPGG